MGKFLKGTALTLLVLLLLAAVLFTVSRLSSPSTAERQALALMQPQPPQEGHNAFATLWLLPWDIPADQRQAIVDADLARVNKALAVAPDDELVPELPWTSEAQDRFPRVTKETAKAWACDLGGDDCLALVRQQRDAVAAALAGNQALLQRVRSLADAAYFHNPMPRTTSAPYPELTLLSVSRAQTALDFVDGRVDAALQSACSDVLTWRRLASRSDSLVVSMVGAAVVSGNTRQLAQMLAELPRDHALPPLCRQAFDLAVVKPDMCPAMRGEARLAFMTFDRMPAAGGALMPLLLEPEATKAMLAHAYAPMCSDTLRRWMASDGVDGELPGPEPTGSRWRPACWSNVVGCGLVQLVSPAWTHYAKRLQDMRAKVRLVHWLLEWRQQAAVAPLQLAALQQRLARNPPPGRAVTLDEDAMLLGFSLAAEPSDAWQVSVPGSQLAAETDKNSVRKPPPAAATPGG